MNLPDGNALDLLEEMRESATPGEWLFLTGFGTVADSVRELRNVIERCVVFADGPVFPVRRMQLPGRLDGEAAARVDGDVLTLPLDGSMSLEDMDRHIVQTALE